MLVIIILTRIPIFQEVFWCIVIHLAPLSYPFVPPDIHIFLKTLEVVGPAFSILLMVVGVIGTNYAPNPVKPLVIHLGVWQVMNIDKLPYLPFTPPEDRII